MKLQKLRGEPEAKVQVQRFSLKSLLGVLFLVPIGVLSLVNASPNWNTAIGLVTFTLLLVSILRTIQLRDRERAWWLGFALFGWGYFLFVHPATVGEAVSVSHLFDGIGRSLRRTVPIQSLEPSWVRSTAKENGKIVAVVVDPRDVELIGQKMLCIVFACIGGWLALFFYSRQGQMSPAGTRLPQERS